MKERFRAYILYIVLLPILLALSVVLNTHSVYADNLIQSIEKNVTVERNGDARVEEVWMVHVDSGTEIYQAFSDLRGKEITDLSVQDEQGHEFTTVGAWNTNWSFQQKAYKAGYHAIADGVELCFGISEYGTKTYVINYVIHDLVTQYTDFPGIYFDFLKMDMTVYDAKLTIQMADGTALSTDTARMWAFGYTGTDTFEDDGTAVFQPSRYLGSSEHMQVLMFFGTELFDELAITSELSSQEVFDEAVADSEYKAPSTTTKSYDYKSNRSLFSQFGFIFVMALPFVGLWGLIALFKFLKAKFSHKTDNFGKDKFDDGKKLAKMREIPESNIIPCGGDLALIYYLMNVYDIDSEQGRRKGLIGARMLEFVRDKHVTFTLAMHKYWHGSKEEYAINVQNLASADLNGDGFANLLVKAADSDKILTKNELKNYCKQHYSELENWFRAIHNIGQARAADAGLIIEIPENRNWFHYHNPNWGKRYTITHQAKAQAEQILALKKYLLNFSTITHDVGVQDVVVWERYLIFATLVGIADKVEEQLKIHYPEVLEKVSFAEFGDFDTLSFVSDISTLSYAAMSMGIAAAARASASHSMMSSIGSSGFSGGSDWGGGGGSASFSGGGSSGGSSGGGIR